jgi:Ca2+-binding EF-hand superfamily protein
MSRIGGVLARIKKSCEGLRVHIDDVVSEYDRTRTGKLSVVHLQRAFSKYGIRIGTQDLQDIELEFKHSDGVISLEPFVSAVDRSDSTYTLNPHPEVTKELNTIDQELAVEQRTIWDCLHEFGRITHGCMAAGDFVRALGSTPHSRAVADAFASKTTGLILIAEIENAIKVARKNVQREEKPPKPDQVVSAIEQIVRRNVDARSGFLAHDRLKRGRIIPETFAMLVSTFSGVQMVPSDIKVVTDYYTVDGLADYVTFCSDIEKALNVVKPAPRPVVSQYDVSKLMNTLRTTFIERRISVRSLFPANGTGKIAKYAFETIVRQARSILTAAEVTAISSAFAAGSNEVDYEKFINALEVRRIAATTSVVATREKIKAALAEQRVALKQVFVRFDRRGTGDLARNHLILALQQRGISLANNEVDDLLRAYPGTAPDRLDIKTFCDAVDPEPLVPDTTAATVPVPTTPRSLPRAVPAAHVLDLVVRIGGYAKSVGVDLLQEFYRIDRLRRGAVTEAQWRSVLTLICTRLTEPELATVFRQYVVDGAFDYNSFCRDTHEDQPSISTDPPELDDVLRMCKALITSKMTTVDVLFRRYDPTRTGLIAVASLPKAFTDLGLLLSAAQIEALQRAFGDQRGRDRFNYFAFDRRLRDVVVRRADHETTLFKGYIEEHYRGILASLLIELREKLRARPRGRRTFLAKTNQETITQADLLAALDEAGVVLLKEQIEALTVGYRLQGTDLIDCARFVRDIENAAIIGTG